MDTPRAHRTDGLVAAFLGILAFGTYVATLAVGAFPGLFSSALVQGLGLFPRLSPNTPLWFAVAAVIRRLPDGGDPARMLHLFSALCATLAVALLYLVMRATVFACIRHDDDESAAQAQRAARIAGVGAALALTFSVPFWIVATRCHWTAFHMAFFLGTAHLFLVAMTRNRRSLEWLWGFVYGLGIVEYATFIIFIPLFTCVYIFVLYRRESLDLRTWGPTALALFAGLGLYALAAWQFMGTEGFALRGHHGFFEVLWSFWRDQWFLLARSLPRQGWLVVLIVTALPAGICLMVARRALNDENDWTYLLLHLVLTALSVAVLLNLRFAPWSMLGFQRLLVMPYVLLAAVFGYVLAFWYRLPLGWWRRSAGPLRQSIRMVFGPVMVGLGLALVILAAFRNLSQANGRPSAMIRQFAVEIVQSLEGRSWLVTDGALDGAILVEAHRLGIPVRILDLSAEKSPLMQAYVSGHLSDPRLRNLAKLSFRTLLRTWLERDPEVDQTVALLLQPEVWSGAGFQEWPNRAVFLGARAIPPEQAEAIMNAQRAAWDRIAASPYFSGKKSPGLLGVYQRHILRHFGMVANNVGVLMEDLNRPELAFEAYRQARVLDTLNISALMNQYTMVDHGFATPEATAVRADLMAARAALTQQRPQMTFISQRYGHVRSPTAFASLGQDWALAGRPELAASGLRRAMGLVPEGERAGMKQALAGLYLEQQREVDSENLYFELLVEDPEHPTALLGMARVEMSRHQPEKARMYLERAEAAGIPLPLMRLEWAAFALTKGDYAAAAPLLQAAVEESPESMRAWSMLISMHIQQRDALALYESILRLQRVKRGNAHLLAVANGYLAMMQDDYPGASLAFEKALALQPRDLHLLEWLLRLDLLQGQTHRLDGRLRDLLQQDPHNAFGNFVLAGLQMERGQFDLARDSLHRSLETQRTPQALNDLAWLLQESGLFTEAETHVRAALEILPGLYQAWDTLGVILVKTDRLDDAWEAFNQALTLQPESIVIGLHMADLEFKMGRGDEAQRRVAGLGLRRAEMTPEESALWGDLNRRR